MLPTLHGLYQQAMQQPPKLLDQIRSRIRYKHYSIRTEEAYVDWNRRLARYQVLLGNVGMPSSAWRGR